MSIVARSSFNSIIPSIAVDSVIASTGIDQVVAAITLDVIIGCCCKICQTECVGINSVILGCTSDRVLP